MEDGSVLPHGLTQKRVNAGSRVGLASATKLSARGLLRQRDGTSFIDRDVVP